MEIEPARAAPARSRREGDGERRAAALWPRSARTSIVVALDERGTEMTTRELAAWLQSALQDGRDLAFLIGGPDGFAPEFWQRSDFKWSLSRLTFPHALVRVVLAEQLYRAMACWPIIRIIATDVPPEQQAPLVCLASVSPRRRELLTQIGVPHVVAGARHR